MTALTSELTSKILLIFELEGWQGVEDYAKAKPDTARRLPQDRR